MRIIILLTVLLSTTTAFSQTYTFAAFPGGYSDLISSTSLNNGQVWDDPNYTVPIGFNFEYFGESMTSIEISDEGLGGLLIGGDCIVDPTMSYLVAYGADIIDRGYDGVVSLSNISYKTEGTVGNRICKIEWRNVGFYDGTTDANGNKIDYLNFQLWFYETTNVVEIRFGPKSITEPLIDFEGETGSFVILADQIGCNSGDILGHELILSGTPANPDFYDDVYSLEDTLLFLNGVIPPLTVYRFTPASTASQNELSVSNPSFSVVPNPSEDQITLIQVEGSSSKISNISIVDMSGKVLLSNLEFNTEIPIDKLQSGMYFIKVAMETGEIYSEKFTKR